jgi:hypothetical protein
MPEDRKKLTDATLQALMSRVRSDAALEKRLLRTIDDGGVMRAVDEFFVLDDKQKLNAGTLKPKSPMERQLASAVTAALTTGGSIRLTRPDFKPVEPVDSGAGVSFGVHNGPDGTDVSVDIHCVQ